MTSGSSTVSPSLPAPVLAICAFMPLDVGIPAGLQLGTNLGHNAVALLNVDLKFNAVNARHFGLSLQAGIKWLNPANVYALPQSIRKEGLPDRISVRAANATFQCQIGNGEATCSAGPNLSVTFPL